MEVIQSRVQLTQYIEPDCKVTNSKIAESILEAECEIQSVALCRSLIGRQAKVQGRGDEHFIQLNIGDSSYATLSDPSE